MALADTTFVNLRNSLDALTPLVNASKPVAPKLQQFLAQLRPLAQNAVPTVQNLASLICSRGSKPCSQSVPGNNDLLQLLELSVQLANVACGTSGSTSSCNGSLAADGKQRLGAFPSRPIALNDSTPELATARPYAVDLTGWFEGYSHPGRRRRQRRLQPRRAGRRRRLDRERRAQPAAVVPRSGAARRCSRSAAAAPLRRRARRARGSTSGQGDRCPGSMERGGALLPGVRAIPCNPSEVPTGN